MPRPSAFDRNAAVETAMQEIWTKGYEATSVKAMSEALGITRSSYYNAFGSREDLYKQVLALYSKQSPDQPLYAPCQEISVRKLLTSTFREICKVRTSDPGHRGCMIVNGLSELTGFHEELGPLLAETILSSAARIEELLDIAKSRQELNEAFDTKSAAIALQTVLIGSNTLSKAVHDEDDLWCGVKAVLVGLELFEE